MGPKGAYRSGSSCPSSVVSEEGGVFAAWTRIPLLAQAAAAAGVVTLSVCEWPVAWVLCRGPLMAAVAMFPRCLFAGPVWAGELLVSHLTVWPVEILPHPLGGSLWRVPPDWSWACCGLAMLSCLDAIL